jgi:hypothetical protein
LIAIKAPRFNQTKILLMSQLRFRLRHAIVGYIVALVFALNGLLTGVIDAHVAAGGNAVPIITCLGDEPSGQLPGQSDHAAKCSCSLSCCCAGGLAARNSSESDIGYAVADAAALGRAPSHVVRDFSADHPLHLRSPPAVNS